MGVSVSPWAVNPAGAVGGGGVQTPTPLTNAGNTMTGTAAGAATGPLNTNNYGAPPTPQSTEVSGANTNWNQQGANVYNQQTVAQGGQATAQAATTASEGTLDAWAPTNIQNYQPTALQNYNPSTGLFGPSGSASTAANTFLGGPVANGGAGNFTQASADAQAIEAFDPTSYGTTYAQGAETAFNQNLATQLDALQKSAAGTGRLQTGFYTGDQGTVTTQLGENFNAQLMQAAETFSGQKLSALEGGASADTSIAQDQAANAQAAANEANNVALARESMVTSSDLSEEQMSVQEQEQASAQGLAQANDLSQLGLTKATDLDTLGLQQTTTGLEAALQEESMARNSASAANATAASFTSATEALAQSDKQSQDQIAYNTALALYMQGKGGYPTGPGGPVIPMTPTGGSPPSTTPDPYAAQESEAAAWGVPFYGPGSGG
jgi:hypothetical protein